MSFSTGEKDKLTVSKSNKATDFIGMQNIKTAIFYQQSINCLMFSPNKGQYNIFFDGKVFLNDEKDFVLQLTIVNDQIEVRGVEKIIGKYKTVDFIGIDSANSFKIKCVNPDKAIRIYDDNLSVKILDNNFRLINEVNLDNYVSCVVESETGTKATTEYYKLQSIICRTYALGHLRRHELEGFNVCDLVHCQVDHGSLKVTDQIRNATKETSGLVLVDQNSEIVLAAFHSNCGGNTCNSEDVWSLSRPYLKSFPDSFCTKQNHAHWEKKIPMNDWKKYKRKGLSEMRPYNIGDDMTGVSVSDADKQNGSPKVGDMIARNPKNHDDKWLVAEKYFNDNLELAE